MKKVCVTGAAGFLGSHLSIYHLKRGDHVVGIDNFSSSDEDSEHFKRLQSFVNFEFICGDIVDKTEFRGIKTQNRKFNIMYNFACIASPELYQASPINTVMSSVVGTSNVLDVALEDNAIVVHASTSEVYGEPLTSPQTESLWSHVNSYGPRSCYDCSKMCAESLCYDYLNSFKLDVRVVRIFNTYGPHLLPDDGRVVSNFLRQASVGEPLTVYGDGSQTRSFCYVSDLIDGITKLGRLKDNPKYPINIGNPNEFTILELVKAVKELYPDPQIVEFKPLPKDDPTQRCPDITKAKQLLGWEPKIQLKEGLWKLANYWYETGIIKTAPKLL